MLKIFASMNAFLVVHYRNVLDGRGIACETREYVVPEYPWVELWLSDEAKFDEAMSILREQPDYDEDAWQCGGCGERIEATFDICWQCGTERAAATPEGRTE